MKNLKDFPVVQKSLLFYNRYQKYTPVAFFFGGFTWDSVTLTRIDRLSDNLILLSYLILLGLLILLVNLLEINRVQNSFILKYKEWYPLGIQFFLGGLFSSYVVFYFQSASFTKTFLFLGILILLLIANEFLEKRLTNLYLQSSLYFLSSFSFFIFFIPVVIKKMSTITFILGGLISLLITIGLILIIQRKTEGQDLTKFWRITAVVCGLFVILNIFYAQNWIPPVPLSLKEGAIYHHVSRQEDFYKLAFQKPKWYQFWKSSDDPFYFAEGDSVFCFTAIFAPTALNKNIYHVWQKYFPNRKEWLVTDQLGFEITGGRKGGYRGYTFKRNVSPGDWRVDVMTGDDLILGRINLKIKEAEKVIKSFKVTFK